MLACWFVQRATRIRQALDFGQVLPTAKHDLMVIPGKKRSEPASDIPGADDGEFHIFLLEIREPPTLMIAEIAESYCAPVALCKATSYKAYIDVQITGNDSASMKALEDHIDTVIAEWKRERPQYDLAPVEIIGRAGRIMEYVDRALEAKFQEFGISRATFDVLATLQRSGKPYRMAQRDLMRRLMRTSGSMSIRIDALEREGFVSRLSDKEDRRSVFVSLAPKGLSLLGKVIPEHLANETALLTGLSKADCDQLKSLLRKWLISLEANTLQDSHRQLGITLLDPHTSLAKRRAVGLPDVPGILVHRVEVGSWAEVTGFRKGDLIYAIEGRSVRSIADLRSVLNKSKPRARRFKIMRGSDSIEI